MKLLLLTCLLLYSSIPTAQNGLFNQSGTEGRDVSLVCGNEGKVVWEKGADRGRSTILTAEGGVITQKLRADPGNRYRVHASDLSLLIENLSLSDSGIYYCNSVPVVNLTVYPAPPAAERSPTTSPAVSCCSSVSSREIKSSEDEERPGDPQTTSPMDLEESSGDSTKETSPTPRPPTPTKLPDSSETPTKEPPPTQTPSTPTSRTPWFHYDSSETTKETPPTQTASTPTKLPDSSETSTKEPSPTQTPPTPTRDGNGKHKHRKEYLIPLGVLAGVVLIILALLLLRCYFRRKATKARAADHVYETIKDTSPTTSPTTHPASAAPKEYEAVYVLAGDPDIIKLGLKNQSAASPLAPQSTETTTSEALYSTIQAVDV